MTRVRNYNYSVDHDLSSKPLFKMQTKAEATASLRIEPLQVFFLWFIYISAMIGNNDSICVKAASREIPLHEMDRYREREHNWLWAGNAGCWSLGSLV